jgi:hypothetical protein
MEKQAAPDFLNASGFFEPAPFTLAIDLAPPNFKPWFKKEENKVRNRGVVSILRILRWSSIGL